jgi:hypothetical protein
MALVGRLSEGGVFVQGLFEDCAQVHFAFRALLACTSLSFGHHERLAQLESCWLRDGAFRKHGAADIGIRIDWHSHFEHAHVAEWRAMSKHQKMHAPFNERNE